MLSINVKTNVREFEKQLSNLEFKQMPFATAVALSALAAQAVEAEKTNETKVLDRPRPFTVNSIRMRKATKASQQAQVYMMDIAAEYLMPYQFGGRNVLNKRAKAVLKPVDAKTDLDQYGNLPRNFLRSIKGRSDVFVGTVKTSRGPINGVWQRAGAEDSYATQRRVTKTGKVIIRKVAAYVSEREGRRLKLLVRFVDPHGVRQNLDWFGVAQRTVVANFKREFDAALAKAMATAR